MLRFPPRPKHIILSKEQEALLNWVNGTLMQCSRELYKNPAEASAIGEKYWNLFVNLKRILVSQGPEEPWFPGALAELLHKQVQSEHEIVVLNLDAIENSPIYEVYVPVIVVKPMIDQIIVTSQIGNSDYIKFKPLQNLHVFILPDRGDEQIPGAKHIVFNEDYQYDMIDPDLVEELTKST